METDFLVTFDHVHSMPGQRRPGWCHNGCREFAERLGLDWSAIVKAGGIPASVLMETGDAMAIRLVQHARGNF